MPMEPMPFEQDVVAVAAKFTGEPTLLLFAGEVTWTPDGAVTVIEME